MTCIKRGPSLLFKPRHADKSSPYRVCWSACGLTPALLPSHSFPHPSDCDAPAVWVQCVSHHSGATAGRGGWHPLSFHRKGEHEAVKQSARQRAIVVHTHRPRLHINCIILAQLGPQLCQAQQGVTIVVFLLLIKGLPASASCCSLGKTRSMHCVAGADDKRDS